MPSHLGEDKVLAKLLPDIVTGFYVDVGAYDPLGSSNSHPFYEIGWRGIDVEPLPEFANKLRAAHPKNLIYECVVGDKFIKELTLYAGGELSTLKKEIYERHISKQFKVSDFTELKVSQFTLDHILNLALSVFMFDFSDIDFLSLDVEGSEWEALQGLDLRQYRPRVMCIEATIPSSKIPNWDAWEPYVLNSGYVFAKFDGTNRFYVREEDKHRLTYL